MNDGGITVTKTTTGSIYLQDIQVVVTHQNPTYIPAEKALNSVDLHRALNSKAIFQMLNTMHGAPSKPSDSAQAAMEEENRLLREALRQSTQQGHQLQASMDNLSQQLATLTNAVSKIPAQQTVVVQGAGAVAAQTLSEVVGGDIPMFIPEDLAPKDAVVQLQVQESSSDGDAVSEAQSRLRKLRKGQSG